MNKKILIGIFLAVFLLVSISFVSSAEVNNDVEKKESPLYRLRTKRAITEKISEIVKNIKTKFLGERLYFLPASWLIYENDFSARELLGIKEQIKTEADGPFSCVAGCYTIGCTMMCGGCN
jgi:hypothetical protein